jgi:hypothetical protein
MILRPTVDWLRDSVLASAGLAPTMSLDELRASVSRKRDPHFEELRRRAPGYVHSPEFNVLRNNRLMLGTLRYEANGWCREYDVTASAIARVERYRDMGNQELLVDAANLVEIEWMFPFFSGTRFIETAFGGPPFPDLDARYVASALLAGYRGTRNRAWLVAAANAIEAEFMHPSRPAHFRATERGDECDVGGVVLAP